jgi:hypothetical protein
MSHLTSQRYTLSSEAWTPILTDEEATIMPTPEIGVTICIGTLDEDNAIPLPPEGMTFNHPVSLWAKDRVSEFGHTILGVIK